MFGIIKVSYENRPKNICTIFMKIARALVSRYRRFVFAVKTMPIVCEYMYVRGMVCAVSYLY